MTGTNGPLGYALKELSLRNTPPGMEFIFTSSKTLDLLNGQAVHSFLQEARPYAIIHLAAKSGNANLNKSNPVDMFQENFLMFSNILAASRDSEVQRILMTSSTSAYPSPRLVPANESMLHLGPPSINDYPYAYAKRLMDPLAEMYRTQFGLDICVPIVNGILGPKMNFKNGESLMLAGIMRRFLEYKEFGIGDGYVVQGDGSPLREYTSSDDLANLLLKLLEIEVIPKLINLGNSQAYSVRSYAEMVADALKIDSTKILFTEEFDPKRVVYNQLTDNSLLKSIIEFDFEEIPLAIDKTIHWLRDNYSWATN